MKKDGSARITYAAYVLLLIAFVSLGAFVAALAYDSGLAGAAAVALAASLIASTIGFRIAASMRGRAAAAAGSRYKLSIWTQPLHPHELDRYRMSYRSRQPDDRGVSCAVVSDTAPHVSDRPAREAA